MTRSWLGSLTRGSLGKRRPRRSVVPRLLPLEDRTLPSTITVTNFADGGLRSGSLRDAVLQLNADTGTADDIIQLLPGTYSLTIRNINGRHETAGLTGDLNLTQTGHRWIIQGAGPSTIIDASQLQDRVFQIVNPGTQVVFQDLVIQGGLAQDDGTDGALAGTTDALGGGLLNNGGGVTLNDAVVQSNRAQGGDVAALSGHNARGGGIYSTGGALTIAGATIADNQASGGSGGDATGGGLYATGGSLDIADGLIASNQAIGGDVLTCTTTSGPTGGTGQGGGLYVNGSAFTLAANTLANNRESAGDHGACGVYNGSYGGGIFNLGTLTVSNSTLSGNSASGFYGSGGGIDNEGTLTVSNSILCGNTDSNGGGAIDNNGGTLTVSNSTLFGNSDSGIYLGGGGIFNNYHGTLTVSNSTLSGNTASFYGGGILNRGTLTVSNSTLSGNSTSSGGGIFNGGYGTLTVSNSTLSGNSSSDGGGIFNLGTLTVSNSTLSGNSASSPYSAGGGISTYDPYGTGTVTFTNVTLTDNRATNVGVGGLYVSAGHPILHNTLIAGNFQGATGTTPDDVTGNLDAGGDNNLIGDGSGMTGLVDGINGNRVGSASAPIDPLLGPLADNGGPTLTRALLPGSPAIDAGNNAYATEWDQRGAPFRRIVNGVIDIGAFEVQARGHGTPNRQAVPDPVAVQGIPEGPLAGQLPDLPADPSPAPASGLLDGQAGQSEPVPVPMAGGQHAPGTLFGTDPDTGQPLAFRASLPASDLDALALTMLGGP